MVGAELALAPVAERLIYREPAERVQLALEPDQKTYIPRQTVNLGVAAKTEKGEPAPAVVLLRVVDKSVVTLADDTLGPLLRAETAEAVRRAGSRRDATTLLLTSPEFQRR